MIITPDALVAAYLGDLTETVLMLRWFIFLLVGVLLLISGLVCLVLGIMEPRDWRVLGGGCVLVFLSLKCLEKSYERKSKSRLQPKEWPKVKEPD